jgi:putative membrane protein
MSTENRSAHPFDRGLQPERTALAWRRTALALTVGALVGFRVLPELLGSWTLIPASAGIILASAVLVLASRRYREHHRLLTTQESDRIPLPDGRLAALVTVLTLLAGAACLLLALRPR